MQSELSGLWDCASRSVHALNREKLGSVEELFLTKMSLPTSEKDWDGLAHNMWSAWCVPGCDWHLLAGRVVPTPTVGR